MSQQPEGLKNLTSNSIMQTSEKARWTKNITSFGKARIFLLGVAGVSLSMGLMNKYVYKSQEQEKLEYRRKRLSSKVTDLSDSNGTVIPWSQKNVEEWLYKPVRITGRPLHNMACLIPCKTLGLQGFEYVVPLCTKETPEGVPIEGVFLNKGWMPKERYHVANRYRIEDAFHQQTFTAFVSQLENLQDHSLLGAGNSPTPVRNHWNYADLKDMAKVSRFENKAVVSAAVLESVNLETPLDERNTQWMDISSDYKEDYPYRKTMAGALQSNTMPWDYNNKGNQQINFGVVSGFLALLLSF